MVSANGGILEKLSRADDFITGKQGELLCSITAASPVSLLFHSLRLAAHLIAQPDVVARKDMVILELGSGSGFLGAVVARLVRTAQIHLTDRDGIVLDHLRRTIDQSEYH